MKEKTRKRIKKFTQKKTVGIMKFALFIDALERFFTVFLLFYGEKMSRIYDGPLNGKKIE